MKTKQDNSNKESINFANLIKYWIKLKTVDSNHLNFGLINEKRFQLQKLLFEKGLLTLDTEFLILEQKFFYLISFLDTKNRDFTKEFNEELNRIHSNESINRTNEFWSNDIQTIVQHNQNYELIKLNITDLITQWTRVFNELWIYNDQFHYQIWFKHKFEQFKGKIRAYQCVIIYKQIVNLFNSMTVLIKNQYFNEKEEYLELIQTILMQLAIELEIYFKVKAKRIKTTGHELLSILIIKRIAYLNSKRCNLNLLNSQNFKRNSIDLIGCLKDGAIDKRRWFADLGLIDVNRQLFEKFTDHSFRSWFQPDETSSFDSDRSVNKSIDKSIDKIYDKMYDKSFDKIGDKVSKQSIDKQIVTNNKLSANRSTDKILVSSKFNDLINKQQMLSVSYQSLQLISNEPSSKLIDYLEKIYWNQFWFFLNFNIQHSSLKVTFQSVINDENFDSNDKTNQFQKLLANMKSDFLIEKMYQQFYEFKLISQHKKEEMINKCVSYVTSVYRLCSDRLIKVNTERQKTNSFQFIVQIEDTFNSVAKVIERLDQFRNLEELIFVLISIELINGKVKFIENSFNNERNFNYSTFFTKIQIHLINRLEFILEYKICDAINKNYLVLNSPVLKPTDWMQKLIDEIFQSLLKFKNKSNQATFVQSKIEQIYLRKFNLFLIRIYDLTLREQRKLIDQLKESVQFYMNWVSTNYSQHLNRTNFPNYFLELLEHNLHFENNHHLFINRKSPINRNQIAPYQTIYESNFESSSHSSFSNRDSFKNLPFRSEIEYKLKLSNRKSYFRRIFCFETT